MTLRSGISAFLILMSLLFGQAPAQEVTILPIAREFRGAWIATVSNIDWPKRQGLSSQEQQSQLIKQLDLAAELGMNAIIFQIRPTGDTFYASPYEPWSHYLTGETGKAPEPLYDPLAFVIEESHKRGMELHAWINPYRVGFKSSHQNLPNNHIKNQRPDLVREFDKYYWLDPGDSEVRNYIRHVVIDIVSRYDIDALHMDDYFYPYPQQGVPFPDEKTYGNYQSAGGKLSKSEWRKNNVNQLIQELARDIKVTKPHVRFGISPFGIWKSGTPSGIRGLSAVDTLHADSRRWLREGWVDYLAPQLYWPTSAEQQSFPVLLDWWNRENPKGRHLWPGMYTSRIGDSKPKPISSDEIINQINFTRGTETGAGAIHFSMKAIEANRGGIADKLRVAYRLPALPPASPWLDSTPPSAPLVSLSEDGETVSWQPAEEDELRFWVVQVLLPNGVYTDVLDRGTVTLDLKAGSQAQVVSVSAVDLVGNISPGARVIIPSP